MKPMFACAVAFGIAIIAPLSAIADSRPDQGEELQNSMKHELEKLEKYEHVSVIDIQSSGGELLSQNVEVSGWVRASGAALKLYQDEDSSSYVEISSTRLPQRMHRSLIESCSYTPCSVTIGGSVIPNSSGNALAVLAQYIKSN